MPKLDEQTQKARREQILDAAERCFTRQGFHGASMQDICREAGVSPGALYIYFTSKEGLIAGICEREKAKLGQALASVSEAPDFLAALARLAETYCLDEPQEKLRLQLEINAEAMRNPDIGRMVAEIDKFVVTSLERLIADAKAKGRIDPPNDPATTALLISMLGDGLFVRRALDPDFDGKACMPALLSLISSLIGPVNKGGTANVEPPGSDREKVGAQDV
ncbi:MAG: TetR/AcrR family transcriptional regulator [Rhodomicrobiaceae bacterium]